MRVNEGTIEHLETESLHPSYKTSQESTGDMSDTSHSAKTQFVPSSPVNPLACLRVDGNYAMDASDEASLQSSTSNHSFGEIESGRVIQTYRIRVDSTAITAIATIWTAQLVPAWRSLGATATPGGCRFVGNESGSTADRKGQVNVRLQNQSALRSANLLFCGDSVLALENQWTSIQACFAAQEDSDCAKALKSLTEIPGVQLLSQSAKWAEA